MLNKTFIEESVCGHVKTITEYHLFNKYDHVHDCNHENHLNNLVLNFWVHFLNKNIASESVMSKMSNWENT